MLKPTSPVLVLRDPGSKPAPQSLWGHERAREVTREREREREEGCSRVNIVHDDRAAATIDVHLDRGDHDPGAVWEADILVVANHRHNY